MRATLLRAVGLGGLVAAGLLLTLAPHAGAANPACPPGAAGTLANISRAIVPIGFSATRTFTVNKGGHVLTITNLRVTAPAEYGAEQVADKAGYALRLKAPHAGAFDVQGTWTVSYTDESGASVTCDATGIATLEATRGTLLPVTPPKWSSNKNPIVWTWLCKPDSDPTPRSVTIRWEVDPRDLPLFSRGGNPPFRFKHHPKTLRATTADPCDSSQSAGFTRKRLQKGGMLTVFLGRAAHSSVGGLLVRFNGVFRNPKNGNAHALHLGIALRAGPRVLANVKVCTFDSFYFILAKGKHVACWW
jgi:hypothetical protein